MYTFALEPIDLDDIPLATLRSDAAPGMRAFRITIYSTIEAQIEEPEPAYALFDEAGGRLGIARGGDCSWARVADLPLERAIDTWLNLREEWDRRA